jgi:hypothetical protein
MPSARTNSSLQVFTRLCLRFLHTTIPIGIACLLLALLATAQPDTARTASATPKTWSGILVSSACNADEAFNESPECFKTVPGAKFALYDDTNRLIYALEPQEKVSAHLGEAITVHGTLDGETIQLASIAPMALGLAVGEKARSFSARDQFGQAQTLDTLKGPNGTVLLFFRSADW